MIPETWRFTILKPMHPCFCDHIDRNVGRGKTSILPFVQDTTKTLPKLKLFKQGNLFVSKTRCQNKTLLSFRLQS